MAWQVATVSLGCSKNQVDLEIMLGLLKNQGFLLTGNPWEADVLLVNTCGFIQAAKEEAIDAILEWVEVKKGRNEQPPLLVVTGCLVQRYAGELRKEIPEIDILAGTGAVEEIPGLIIEALRGTGRSRTCVGEAGHLSQTVLPRIRWDGGASAYLKIAEGCNNLCRYCAIPMIRGAFKSRNIPSLVEEARRLAQDGVKELVLIAQDTTMYGIDLYGRPMLPELLRALDGIEELGWIRFLYAQPPLVSGELIETMAQSRKICHYLDIPFQHSSRRVLESMGRWGDGEIYLNLLSRIRRAMPDVILRTTFMVGFPGETEEDFANLLEFLKKGDFHRAGAFVFSPEEGTPAAEFASQVPVEIAESRLQGLMSAQQVISQRHLAARLGKVEKILVEGAMGEGLYYGRNWREAPEVDGRTIFSAPPGIKIPSFAPIYIKSVTAHDLAGEMLGVEQA